MMSAICDICEYLACCIVYWDVALSFCGAFSSVLVGDDAAFTVLLDAINERVK